MNHPIRSATGHDITAKKLREGYREQRAWLSVGMEQHCVELFYDGTMERPYVVSYRVHSAGVKAEVYRKRFARNDLALARSVFRSAGKPGQWPRRQPLVNGGSDR